MDLAFFSSYYCNRAMRRLITMLCIALFAQNTFALENAKAASRFIDSIGVNVHLNYTDTAYSNATLVETEVQRLGVLHLRDGYGSYKLPSLIRLGRLGVRFGLNVPSPYSAANLNAAIAATTEAGTPYIEAWEGWNEMDAWDRNWKTDLGASFAALKAANTAGVALWGPPLADAKNSAQLDPLQATYGTFHPYPAGQNPSIFIAEQLKLIQPLFPGAPIIASETGYHNALNDHRDQPGIDFATGAKYVPRLLLENFKAGVYRTYLYELLNEHSTINAKLQDINNNCEQCNWGLVTETGAEKPAFIAVANLIKILNQGGLESSTPGSLTYTLSGARNVKHLLLQKAPGIFDLILWQDVASWDHTAQKPIPVPNQAVTLSVMATSVISYLPSISQNGVALAINRGKVIVYVPDEALVLEIQASSKN